MYIKQTTYTYILYYISHKTYVLVPMYDIRVDGGVSYRSRTFLGLFRKMKKMSLQRLLVYFYSLFDRQQNTEYTVKGVRRISPIEFIQQ